MKTYIRRPFLMGNTDSPVLVQPAIVGSVRQSDDGSFDFTGGEIIIETDQSAGELAATFPNQVNPWQMVDVLGVINLLTGVVAETQDGCLKISTTGTGGAAFVRVIQCLDSGSATGLPDVAARFGFPVAPNPSAMVRGGDEESTPVRSTVEANPTGTMFIGRGEDRIGRNYNRALHALGTNTDVLHTMLSAPVAVPVVIEIDRTDPFWDNGTHIRVKLDANNEISQINLSDLEVAYPELTGRLFVGELSRLSSLDDIAAYFSVMDSDNKEIMVQDSVLRVGAVTRGRRLGGAPEFANGEDAAPTIALNDTQPGPADGKNALGVSYLKQSSVVITEIRQRTLLVCPSAEFRTRGVVPGDTATVSSSGIHIPFGHNGVYLVEQVVSETEIILRPSSSDNVQEFNPGDGPGSLGHLIITSGGTWEKDTWITLSPSLPRWPEDGKLRLVLGVESTLGELPVEALLTSTIRTSEEVSAWVTRQLWRRQSVQGAYDGMANGNGGGATATVSDRPVTLVGTAPELPAAGSVVINGTGTILSGNVLKVGNSDTFLLEYVGLTVSVSSATNGTNILCYIDTWLDGSHVHLVPPSNQPDLELVAEAATYVVLSGNRKELPAVQQLVALISPWGMVVIREQTDTDPGVPPTPAWGYSHLERVKVGRDGAGAAVDLTTLALTLHASNVVTLAVNVAESWNIHSESTAALHTVSPGARPGTLLRVLNGTHAGWYRIKETDVAPDRLIILNLDGTSPVFSSGTALGALYNFHFGTGLWTSGDSGSAKYRMGSFSFEDGYETGADFSVGTGTGWSGVGAGFWGVINDPEFKAYDDGVGGSGPLFGGFVYAPALGSLIIAKAADSGAENRRKTYAYTGRVHSNVLDFALGSPTDYAGWGAEFVQTGRDPGLIVFKHDGTAGTAPAPGSFLSTAASVLGYGGKHTGRGGAQDVIGSIYQWAGIDGETTFTEGGIYTEVGMGAGRWMAPMYGGQAFPLDQPYEGIDTYADLQSPTRLGSSGRMIPASAAVASSSGHIYAPSFVMFNYPHWGRLRHTTGPFDLPLAQWVGTKVVVVLDSTDGSYTGKEFQVCGIYDDGTHTYLALLPNEDSAVPAVTHTTTFTVHGQRWYQSYIDIADWTRIGTRFDPSENWRTPILTVGQYSTQAVHRAARTGATTDINLATSGLLSDAGYWPRTDGEGIGEGAALSAMANFSVTTDAEVPAWNDPANPSFVTTTWAQDNHEPRTPFPNVAVITAGAYGILQLTDPGSLVCDDVALEHVTLNSSLGHYLKWSSAYGGSLKLASHSPEAIDTVTDVVRVWLRGVRGFTSAHYGLRVTVILGKYESLQVDAHIRTRDGTSLASQPLVFGGNTHAPREMVADITLSDLLDKPYNTINENTLFTEGIHLTLDFTSDPYTAAVDPTYIIKVQVEQIVRPAKTIGAVDVAGAVRAHSYRYMSPVRGFQTVSPADVEFLNSSEYAKLMGQNSPDDGRDYGELETKGTGLFKAAEEYVNSVSIDGSNHNINVDDWFSPIFDTAEMFRRGPHSATIRVTSPAFDPMWYAQQSAAYTSSPSDTVSASRYVLPGRTGFVLPLNPPHGSRLTSFHLGMSFSPCHSRSVDGDPATSDDLLSNFQVWHTQLPAMDRAVSAWGDLTEWGDREGVRVSLYRYNALDIDLELASSSYTGTGPEYGWAEEIWTDNIELSGDTEPTNEANTGFSTETFKKLAVNLHQTVSNQQKMMVDRRQYGYFAVVSFWCGCRAVSASDNYFHYYQDDWAFHTPSLFMWSSGGTYSLFLKGRKSASPAKTHTTLKKGFYPAQVKFRGARLGWETDRGGNGGWG